jgi:hypothetical protein
MSGTLFEINEHIARMEALGREMLGISAEINKLRAECQHVWSFSFQVNAHHNTIWHVFYQCNKCATQREEKKEPVCEVHDVTLVRCDASDVEAEAERTKPEHGGGWNIPLAFRCPKPECCKIHILRHRGD